MRIVLKKSTILRTCTAQDATSESTSAISMQVFVMQIQRLSVKSALKKPSIYAACVQMSMLSGSLIVFGIAMNAMLLYQVKNLLRALTICPVSIVNANVNANLQLIAISVAIVFKKSMMILLVLLFQNLVVTHQETHVHKQHNNEMQINVN